MTINPATIHPAIEEARAAVAREDYPAAESIWAAFVAEFPEDPRGYVGLARALRAQKRAAEAESVLSPVADSFVSHRGFATIYAQLAQALQDWPQALSRWRNVLSLSPEDANAHVGAGAAARAMMQYDEADAILAPAVERFPNLPAVAIAYAYVAHYRPDHAQGYDRWRQVIERFPEHPTGYAGAAGALRSLKRYDETDTLLTDAVARFPEDGRLLSEHIQAASLRGDNEEALRRSLIMRRRLPLNPIGHMRAAENLERLGRPVEADMILTTAIEALPRDARLSGALAMLTRARGDWLATERRWTEFRDRFPDNPQGYAGLGEALRHQKRFDDSDVVLTAALAKFPMAENILVNHALVPHDRGDWVEAQRRWARVREIAPDNAQLKLRSGDADLFANLAHLDSEPGEGTAKTAAPAVAAADIVAVLDRADSADLRAMYMQFEGLGSDCEFGLAQRRFGAEPLGLLRFIEVAPDSLAEALASRLEGVGDPEHTSIFMGDGEYRTRDKRYVMTIHTCIREVQTDMEKFFLTCCRRIRYLKDKLVDDLETGDKIFVYQSQNMTGRDITRLHGVIRSYGDNTLLCVRRTVRGKRAGQVERVAPGLLVAWRDRGGRQGERRGWDINYDEWTEICKAALKLRQAPADSDDTVHLRGMATPPTLASEGTSI